MKLIIPTACAAAMALATAGAVQAASPTHESTNKAATATGTTSSTTSPGQPGVKQFKSDLESAGFTDVKIMPQSFIVRAKDKHGRPVMMVLNPDSFTEVVGMSAMKPANPPPNTQPNK